MIHRQLKFNDMHSSSIKDILAQPEIDNKSKLNKQKVMDKKQNKIQREVNTLAIANQENELIPKPNHDWRVNSLAAEVKKTVPVHYKDR